MISKNRPSVLLVEPAETVRTTVSAFLEAHLFHVEAAHDDGEAIRMLDGFAAVVVNVNLQTNFGFELLEHISRNLPALLSRVVVITSDETGAVAAALSRIGFCEIVPKPIRAEEILAAVQECLQMTPADVH